jgi:hypothetical protein
MPRVPLLALTLAGGGAAALGSVGGAAAQVVAESTLRATISQSIEADTNYDLDADSPGTTYYGDTRLGVQVIRNTDTRQLLLDVSTGLRPIKRPEEDFELNLADPSSAGFAYAQEFANAAFNIDLGARVQRVDRLRFDEFLLPGDDIPLLPEDVTTIRQDALERRLDLDAGFTLGTSSPSSLGVRLQASDVDYTGDESEELTARTAGEADAVWRLRVGPVLSGAVLARYAYEDADNPEESQIEESEVDLGVIYEPSEALSLTVGAGYATRTLRETDPVTGERTDVEDDGGISLRALGQYQTEENSFGFNTRYTTAAPEARFEGSLNASFTLPRSSITARVFQDFGFGAEEAEEERRVTGASLGYNYTINSLSTVGLSISAANSVAAGGGDEDDEDGDRNQVELTAQYNRSLTALVAASLGYQLTQRFEDPDDLTSHRVFFQIGRTFETGL